jgi:hypothetical protein
MIELPRVIPDPDLLLALEPEELAVKLLFLLRQRGQRGEDMFHPDGLLDELCGDHTRGRPGYPRKRGKEIELAFAEAWAWLETQGLVLPTAGATTRCCCACPRNR